MQQHFAGILKIIYMLIFVSTAVLVGYVLIPPPDGMPQYHSNTDVLSRSPLPYSTAIFDRNNTLLKLTLADDERYRLPISLSDVPQSLINATVLYEDQDYYQHLGVDSPALMRAFYQTYIKGERKIGASTLPMQVARLHWQINSSSLAGKLIQIFRALQLVKHYSKDQILALYFNLAPYGGNIEGVAAASLIYFNKPPAQLNALEAMTLAVIPQNPNKRNPHKPSSWASIRKATQILYSRRPELFPAVTRKMLEMHLKVYSKQELPNLAPHFTDFVHAQYNTDDKDISKTSVTAKYFVTTTLDLLKQDMLTQGLQRYVQNKREQGLSNAAALLLNHRTMQIEAMIGSADFTNHKISGQVNGTTAMRSPGSTLKPLLYGLAIDSGLIHAGSILKDLPKRYAGFSPENADSAYLGPISASQALITSRNLPAVDLQQQLTHVAPTDDLYNSLLKMNLSLQPASFYGLALSLGGLELTMMDVVELYASFANAGTFSKSTFLLADEAASAKAGTQLMSPEASALVMDILRQNPRPAESTHASYQYLPTSNVPEVAWKTGTSWGFRDGWAIGVSGDYVLAVWVGNFSGQGNPIFKGKQTAGPLLFDMLDQLNRHKIINPEWQVKDLYHHHDLNVKTVAICQPSGDLFEQGCPTSIDTLFIPGKSPIKSSNVFRQIKVHMPTGQRACASLTTDVDYKTFAVWPSDVARNFELAGIRYAPLPNLHPQCRLRLSENSVSGVANVPQITSLQSSVSYIAQRDVNGELSAIIPLQASVDGVVTTISWFVNNSYQVSLSATETYAWHAPVGAHSIMLVDDLGQFTTQVVNVLAQ